MTDERLHMNSNAGDDDVRRLLQLAGPRLRPPADVEARVRAATLKAFDELPVRPSHRFAAVRAHGRWAMAAALLVVMGIGYLVSRDAGEVNTAGNVLFASGAYTVRGSATGLEQLAEGAIVQTSTGRLFIGLGGEQTLRMDRGASLTLHSQREIWLHSGRIYIDAPGAESVTVVTPYAAITDIGTQFEVSVAGEDLTVATREGRVEVQIGGTTVESAPAPGEAEELRILGARLESREVMSATGERWRWTQTARPLFPVQDRTIEAYLRWATRESGLGLRFESELAQQQAGLRRLSGAAEVDADVASIQRVLATTIFIALPGESNELLIGLR